MRTKTTIIAKRVINLLNKGGRLWNDKLRTGERSLKVEQWDIVDYLVCKKHLEDAGCTVKVAAAPKPFVWQRRYFPAEIRLHVTE